MLILKAGGAGPTTIEIDGVRGTISLELFAKSVLNLVKANKPVEQGPQRETLIAPVRDQLMLMVQIVKGEGLLAHWISEPQMHTLNLDPSIHGYLSERVKNAGTANPPNFKDEILDALRPSPKGYSQIRVQFPALVWSALRGWQSEHEQWSLSTTRLGIYTGDTMIAPSGGAPARLKAGVFTLGHAAPSSGVVCWGSMRGGTVPSRQAMMDLFWLSTFAAEHYQFSDTFHWHHIDTLIRAARTDEQGLYLELPAYSQRATGDYSRTVLI